VTKADWDNTQLFEVMELAKHARSVVEAIEIRIRDLKSRHGTS
jgi:hypothetical protein